ncbi:hypothetical protein Leryth_024101 [Lithospermum erythrorhizon]|nr:hypothetical protein Leryth_024101 [Lithospermum erythrorhizon]
MLGVLLTPTATWRSNYKKGGIGLKQCRSTRPSRFLGGSRKVAVIRAERLISKAIPLEPLNDDDYIMLRNLNARKKVGRCGGNKRAHEKEGCQEAGGLQCN